MSWARLNKKGYKNVPDRTAVETHNKPRLQKGLKQEIRKLSNWKAANLFLGPPSHSSLLLSLDWFYPHLCSFRKRCLVSAPWLASSCFPFISTIHPNLQTDWILIRNSWKRECGWPSVGQVSFPNPIHKRGARENSKSSNALTWAQTVFRDRLSRYPRRCSLRILRFVLNKGLECEFSVFIDRWCFKNKDIQKFSTVKAGMPNQYFCPCKNKTSPYLHWNRLQAKQRLSLGSRFVSAPTIRHTLDWKHQVSHHRIQ